MFLIKYLIEVLFFWLKVKFCIILIEWWESMDLWDKKKKNIFLFYWMVILLYVEKKMWKFVGFIVNILFVYLVYVVREYWFVYVLY